MILTGRGKSLFVFRCKCDAEIRDGQRRIPKARQSITKLESFVGNKVKSAELLRDICPLVW